jgi:hypothetical protein
MTHEASPSHNADAGRGLSEGLGAAATKRDKLALWGNLIIAHTWGAACWVSPGWAPAAMTLVSLLIAGMILYEDQIKRALEVRAERESA